jgi:hypothetical protein
MAENTTGRLAADLDIDESSGIEHGLEVIVTRPSQSDKSLPDTRVSAERRSGKPHSRSRLRFRVLSKDELQAAAIPFVFGIRHERESMRASYLELRDHQPSSGNFGAFHKI